MTGLTVTSHFNTADWQSIVATVDRTNDLMKIYVNGVESTGGGVDISNLTGNINPDKDLTISDLNFAQPARGRLDDFGIFDHVLSQSEVDAIYNGGTGQTLGAIYVPEPTTSLLSILGLGGLLLRRRR